MTSCDLPEAVFEHSPASVGLRSSVPQDSIHDQAHDLRPTINDEHDLPRNADCPNRTTWASPRLSNPSSIGQKPLLFDPDFVNG